MAKGSDVVERLAYLFSQSQTADDKPFVDVADLCVNLVRNSGEPLVMEAARALGDFLISPRPPVVSGSADGVGKPFIVEHGRNAGGTARLNGLSIYAPHVIPGYDFEAVRHLYEPSISPGRRVGAAWCTSWRNRVSRNGAGRRDHGQ